MRSMQEKSLTKIDRLMAMIQTRSEEHEATEETVGMMSRVILDG